MNVHEGLTMKGTFYEEEGNYRGERVMHDGSFLWRNYRRRAYCEVYTRGFLNYIPAFQRRIIYEGGRVYTELAISVG